MENKHMVKVNDERIQKMLLPMFQILDEKNIISGITIKKK